MKRHSHSRRLPDTLTSFSSFVSQLIRHLWHWFTVPIAALLLAAEFIPSKWIATIPLLPDSFLARFILSLVIGLLFSAYRVFSLQRSTINLLNQQIASGSAVQLEAEFSTGVETSSRSISPALVTIAEPDLDSLEKVARTRTTNTFKRVKDRLQPSSPFGISINSYGLGQERLVDEETYQSSVESYVKSIKLYAASLRHSLIIQYNTVEIRPMLYNRGRISASNVLLEITVPSPHLLLEDYELDWFNGEDLPKLPSAPKASDIFVPIFADPIYDSHFPQQPMDVVDPKAPFIVERGGKPVVKYRIGNVSAGSVIDDLDPFYLVFRTPLQHPEVLHIQVFAEQFPAPMAQDLTIREVPSELLEEQYHFWPDRQ